MSDFQSRKDYDIFSGTNTTSEYQSLPMQMLTRSKKNEKWQKTVMDTLESIGLKQIQENRVFGDYRKMYEGRVVYSDFDEQDSDLRKLGIQEQKKNLPTFIKHYDLIGRIIRLLSGEFNKQRDTLNIVSTDIFSTGEFLREKDSKIRQFTEDYFNKELEIGLIEKGIDPFKKDFQSEEERDQYLQMLKEQRDAIIPPDEIEKDLQKNFKTAIVEWAEKTMESNYIKFGLDMLDTEELIDYLATGRYFRNYYVGYDSYEPETWDVERTFFSQDLDVLYPQDCEYVGTIHYMSGAKVLSKFGHLIPKNIQNKIYGEDFYTSNTDSVGPLTFMHKGMVKPVSVPHAGYYQQRTAQSIQNLFGVPWGKQHYMGAEGELESRYAWVNPNNSGNRLGWGRDYRDDINPRTDDIQVTEAYFRSQKLMGLLTIENPLTETPYQTMVEEDLIPEFLDYYDIKKQSTKSWQEVVDNPMDNINTITYGFLPEIWRGYKLNSTGTNLKEDYYFGVEPLKYQITGARNEFDVKIPVGGIITSGIGEIIRSLQIDYNIVNNLNRQYLEKTIGTFIEIDQNFLPSHLKGADGKVTAEMMEEWREDIRETGIAVLDKSPQNTKGQNPAQNSIQQYDMSFINNIQLNMALSRDIEDKAFALIGITRERQGNPNEYMTGEGIKQGVEASYAQTEIIYKRFNTAKVKEKEIELSIAQYAASNNKDISVNYINGHNERVIQNFVDPNFSFRKLEVFPADDSSKRRELENFKQLVLQRNTMDSSLEELAMLVTSDNFVSVLELGKKAEAKKQQQLQEEREHQLKLNQQNIEAQQSQIQSGWEREDRNKELERQKDITVAEIKARATIADSNADPDVVRDLIDKGKLEASKRDNEIKNSLKSREVDLKEQKIEDDRVLKENTQSIEGLKMIEKAKDRQAKIKISENNKDIARINPG